MEELNDAQKGRLSNEAYEGGQVRDMCKHPGWNVIKKKIDEKITMARNEWLNAKTSLEAEEIRIKTKHYSDIYDVIKSTIMKGDNATLILHQILQSNTPAQADKEN